MGGERRTPEHGDTDVLGRRIVAAVIDAVIGYLLLWGTYVAFGTMATRLLASGAVPFGSLAVVSALGGLAMLLAFLVALGYFAVFEWSWDGRTLGKRAVGIRVVAEDGSECDLAAAVVRNLLRVVDGLVFYALGFVLVATSETRQRFGDRMADTLVVRDE